MDVKMFHAVIHGFEGYEPEPIPLTPEILEKCGFVIIEQGRLCVWFEDFELCQLNSDKNKLGLYWCEHYTGVSIEYLHQLQNIYFALTGEELNIKL
jgi:hypothetical protein